MSWKVNVTNLKRLKSNPEIGFLSDSFGRNFDRVALLSSLADSWSGSVSDIPSIDDHVILERGMTNRELLGSTCDFMDARYHLSPLIHEGR